MTKIDVEALSEKAEEFVVEHQEGIVTGTVMTAAVAGMYAGLTMIKIKWLVLAGLVVVTGGAAGAAYAGITKLVNKAQENKEIRAGV